ncbi:TetR/AcrR family transcriptional regulator [Spirillospora sp. CA-294931]|uniref:TetR/AcrR family transcriptional regulator n=1 Tax=Spirillospora sp. CA-294931 TaxID=3240042 RepID=UPI003D8A2717
MNASRTARERARAELTREIKEEAKRQLGEVGAHALSLRAVSRELGMTSSALYRYFASRDELLTALIIDAYEALGDRVAAAEEKASGQSLRGRWRVGCATIRAWALEHRHEYSLVYGSPVPGYSAPETTVAPAARIAGVILGIVHEAWLEGSITAPIVPLDDLELQRQAPLVHPGLPPHVAVRAAIAWTQLFGMISFELYGHLANTLDPATPFFTHAVETMADLIGLPADP